jgi:hypothetical protein
MLNTFKKLSLSLLIATSTITITSDAFATDIRDETAFNRYVGRSVVTSAVVGVASSFATSLVHSFQDQDLLTELATAIAPKTPGYSNYITWATGAEFFSPWAGAALGFGARLVSQWVRGASTYFGEKDKLYQESHKDAPLSMLGSAIGSIGGATVGSWFGPMGTMLGSTIGSSVGSFVGDMADLGMKHVVTRVLPKAAKKGWSSLMRRLYQPQELNSEVLRRAGEEFNALYRNNTATTPEEYKASLVTNLYLSEEQAEKVYNHIYLREDL